MRVLCLSVSLAVLACGCDAMQGVSNSENTAVNERDADGRTLTPFDQSNEQSDIDLVAKIRQQVLDINGLSINGRNVKIITNQGKAVLRGPVASSAERTNIVAVATKIAGDGNVTDQLDLPAN